MAFTFNPMVLAVGVLAAERRPGASSQQALVMTLLASTLRPPALGVVLALSVGQAQGKSAAEAANRAASAAASGQIAVGQMTVGQPFAGIGAVSRTVGPNAVFSQLG